MAVKLEGQLPLLDAAEFVFDAQGPIPLAELASSFAALDARFSREANNGQRLAAVEIRSGSVVAVLAPYLPMFGQVLQAVEASITVGDFVSRTRAALNAFAGIAPNEKAPEPDPVIAAEIAEIIKPLTGRPGARFGMAHIRYRSDTKDRTVELEATYGAAEIDRASANAVRLASAPPEALLAGGDVEREPSLLRKVKLTLHQANKGPAKDRGQTGDRGTVEAVSDKPLPVYFAKSVNDLKAKLVGSSKNPLITSYMVDVLVDRQDGAPKCYTVIDVHGPARQSRGKAMLPLVDQVRDPAPAPRRVVAAANRSKRQPRLSHDGGS